jgi:hypothetical protein
MQLQDRRRRERTPPQQQGTHIWVKGNRRVCVEVVDESEDGIGLIIPDMSFNLGPHIDVEYGGRRRTAVVAYLNKQDDGRYRLGLEWLAFREV